MSIEEYRARIRAYRAKLIQERNAAQAESPALEAAGDEDDALGRALEDLSDPNQAADVRVGALQWLRAASFHSPTLSDWRPTFLDALRASTEADDQGLREVVFETLVSFGDRDAQQRLIDGLEAPANALVPAAVALRLLSQDPHAPAREAALAFADDAPNEERLEALRVLASDPGSVDRFAGLLADVSQPGEIRALAATALSSLDRARLRSVATEMSAERAALESAAESAADSDVEAHVRALLELPE